MWFMCGSQLDIFEECFDVLESWRAIGSTIKYCDECVMTYGSFAVEVEELGRIERK